jgi:hypothetical protein
MSKAKSIEDYDVVLRACDEDHRFKFKPGDLIRFVDSDVKSLPFDYGIVRERIVIPAKGYKVEPVTHEYELYGNTFNWGEEELELAPGVPRLRVNRFDWSVDWEKELLTNFDFTRGE